jgi:hypothetical protein
MVKLCQTESANALENGWKNTKFELGFRRVENMGSAETWKDLEKKYEETLSLVSPLELEDSQYYDLYQLLFKKDKTDFSIDCRKELLSRADRLEE